MEPISQIMLYKVLQREAQGIAEEGRMDLESSEEGRGQGRRL